MSDDVPPVPYKTPLTDRNGLLTVPWIGWFRQLFMRVGGNVGSILINPMNTLGDMIYGGSSGTPTRLPGDLTDARKFLRSQSAGGIATPPVWDSLQAADIPPLSYVTSVALTTPGIFSVSGSPVTSSGTLALTLTTQSPNTVFAGPSSGSGTPTFRVLVAADIPALAYVGSIGFNGPGGIFSISGSPVTSSGTISQTVSGTSGGIPYFSNATTLSSSGLLTANQLVLGGGSGGAPSTLAAGSQYQVLIMGASNPGYGALPLSQSAAVSGTLPIANGGTGAATREAAIAALLPNQAAQTVKVLHTIGLNGADPVWSSIDLAGVNTSITGTLPVVSGGTGTTTSTGSGNVVLSAAPSFDSYIQFSGISTPSAPSSGSLNLYATTTNSFTRPTYLANENLELILGRDTILIVRNTTGSTIVKGALVYVSGSSGNVPLVQLAKADSTSTLPVAGFVAQDISNNSFGYVYKLGILSNYNTNSWAAGTVLYASAATAGALTSTRPTYPNFAQTVGTVLVQGIGNGSILVRTTTIFEGTESGTVNSFQSSVSMISPKFISSSSNPASAGVIELASGDAITWRNNANSADISLAKNTSDNLTYGGTSLFNSSGVQQAASFPALTGDVTTSAGSLATTLANSGVSAGTYTKITVDAKGRATSGTTAALSDLTGTLAIANGGTGGTSATTALNNLLPSQAGNTGKYLFTDGSNANWNNVVTSVAMTVPSFLSISGSPITTTGTLAVSLSGTALPVANGGTAVTSVTTTPTASSFAGWDANKNLSANALSPDLTSTATAGGTTTMTIASTEGQVWTGSTTQTVKLPTTSVAKGARYFFTNSSSGVVTVQSSGGNTIQAMAGNSFAIFTALVATPTTAANWNVNYSTNNAGGGTVTSVQVTGANGLSFSGGPITTSGTITATLKAPTVQRFTSGSGTYTPPSSPSPLWIKVTMSGGGGGGGGDSGSGTNGGNGNPTTFTSNLTAGSGGGGQANGGNSGVGGSNTVSATSGLTVIKNFQGGGGTVGGSIVTSGFTTSPKGGVNPFGGSSTNLSGLAVSANTGAGGAGGIHSGSTGNAGSSGGAGGYLEVMISGAALSTIIASGASYSVGSGGTAGSGSSANGGVGAAGIIIAEEYYQ